MRQGCRRGESAARAVQVKIYKKADEFPISLEFVRLFHGINNRPRRGRSHDLFFLPRFHSKIAAVAETEGQVFDHRPPLLIGKAPILKFDHLLTSRKGCPAAPPHSQTEAARTAGDCRQDRPRPPGGWAWTARKGNARDSPPQHAGIEFPDPVHAAQQPAQEGAPGRDADPLFPVFPSGCGMAFCQAPVENLLKVFQNASNFL